MLNDNNSTYAGAGYMFACGLGAELTAAASVTLQAGLTVIAGSVTITTILGGGVIPNVAYMQKKAGATWNFGTGGNITGTLPSVKAGDVAVLVWDGTAAWRIVGVFPKNVTDVSALATGGSGTYADPWRGWATAVNALPAGDANALTAGARVYFPSGVYATSIPITTKPLWEVFGDGRLNSIIYQTGLGDGFISTSAINSSSGVYIYYHDFAIYTNNVSNVNAAIVDVGGSFVTIQRVRTYIFNYGIVLDQTEVSNIEDCVIAGWARYGIWLLNSANHTVGALPGFTNRITIADSDINTGSGGGTACINDEGGGAHAFIGNNLNGSQVGLWASAVDGLTIAGNEIEGNTSEAMRFSPTLLTPTFATGAYVGACRGAIVEGNTATAGVGTAIVIAALHGGRFVSNHLGQYTASAFALTSDDITGVTTANNAKITAGAAKTAAPFLAAASATANRVAHNKFAQQNQTYSVAGFAAGARTVTPATMGAYAPELIANGMLLLCVNADGTNAEYTAASGCTATTFDVTLATSKAANFLIYTPQS